MSVNARSQWDHNRKNYFDEKLDILPFALSPPAKRNLFEGILLTHSIEIVNKEEMKKMMLQT